VTEGEKKASFKVVDRRRFTDEGDERQGPDVPRADPVRAEPPTTAKPAAASTSATPAPAPADTQKPRGKPQATASGLTFSVFVQSLAQQALMQMGLIPWPHGQRELALDQARDTVDILELLKAKTEGNLDVDEKQLLDSAVYELKMSFVEVQQAIARSRAGGKPPGMPGAPR
jgi:hypothetical protein